MPKMGKVGFACQGAFFLTKVICSSPSSTLSLQARIVQNATLKKTIKKKKKKKRV